MEEEENVQPMLSIGRALTFKNETEDDTIYSFITESMSITKHSYQVLDNTLSELEHEEIIEESLAKSVEIVHIVENLKSTPVEIRPGKTLNVNPILAPDE